MREQTQRARRNRRSAVTQVARSVRVTNEEILGDLLYPAPADRVSAPRRKSGR